MWRTLISVTAALALVGLASGDVGGGPSSHFGTDADGWSTWGDGTTFWDSIDAEHDGAIVFDDWDSGEGGAIAPAKFLGDLRPYDGGELQYDLLHVSSNGQSMSVHYGAVELTGAGTTLMVDPVPQGMFPPVGWTPVRVPMTAAAWGTDQATWSAVLADVTQIFVHLDPQVDVYDQAALDDFAIGWPIPEPPVPQFMATPLSGLAPLTVTFANTSTGEANSWYWEFGDGQVSTERTPRHVFSQPGVYDVTLSASGPGGTAGLQKTAMIRVHAPAEPRRLALATNLRKAGRDRLKLTLRMNLPDGFTPKGAVIDVDVVGVTDTLVVGRRGVAKGALGKGALRYNRRGGFWQFTMTAKRGDFHGAWATHGLQNADIPEPGLDIRVPVLVVIGENSFMAEPLLTCLAQRDLGGTAKLRK